MLESLVKVSTKPGEDHISHAVWLYPARQEASLVSAVQRGDGAPVCLEAGRGGGGIRVDRATAIAAEPLITRDLTAA